MPVRGILWVILTLAAAAAIGAGAPAPAAESAPPFWAFQPPADPPPPPVKDAAWPKSPLDYFILAGLESKGLSPAPPAQKHVLIRRATDRKRTRPPPRASAAGRSG